MNQACTKSLFWTRIEQIERIFVGRVPFFLAL